MKGKITRSSGNVFQDLGFPSEEAEYLKIRSTLMIHLRKTIEAKGKLHLFSIDILVDMLARAGVHNKLVVGSSKRKLKVA
jgi:predicted XRE-type DNA-binding protein